MLEVFFTSFIKDDPFAIVAFLALLLFGNMKMAKCKKQITKEIKARVSESTLASKEMLAMQQQALLKEIDHLKELIELRMHDQKKLLKIEIHQNKEALDALKKNSDR